MIRPQLANDKQHTKRSFKYLVMLAVPRLARSGAGTVGRTALVSRQAYLTMVSKMTSFVEGMAAARRLRNILREVSSGQSCSTLPRIKTAASLTGCGSKKLCAVTKDRENGVYPLYVHPQNMYVRVILTRPD
jgi:hypothetical protein